jgi:hypothetical protein
MWFEQQLIATATLPSADLSWAVSVPNPLEELFFKININMIYVIIIEKDAHFAQGTVIVGPAH